MTLSKTEHAIMTRLAQGPATYEELGEAAGISSDGARKTCTRGLLRVRRWWSPTHRRQGPTGAMCCASPRRGVKRCRAQSSRSAGRTPTESRWRT